VLVLDGVFDGDDVLAAARVDQVEQCGQRRGFAAARGTGHQQQPVLAFRQAAQHRRQVQGFERRDPRRQQPYAGRQGAALVVYVGAASRRLAAYEAEIHRAPLLQLLVLPRREQRQHHGAQVLGRQGGRGMRRRPGAVHAHRGGRAADQQQVGSVQARRGVQ